MPDEILARRSFLRKSTAALTGLSLLGTQRVLAQPLPFTDIVVLLPGITGSVLQKNGRNVWAITGHSILDTLGTFGRNLEGLQLHEDPEDHDELGDGVVATEVFPDVHLVPGLWKIDGYSNVYSALTRKVSLRRGSNFFEFPYDWRRDNRVAARKLARLAPQWLDRWRRSSKHAEAKLVLVAHSMGGLVARYYLECLEGWRDTRKLITFGTPYRGSLNALEFLANGYPKHFMGLNVADLAQLMRSFTSVYQLLPRYPCVQMQDGTWKRPGEVTGLRDLDARKAAQGLAFHYELEQAICRNHHSPEYVPYGLHTIIGVDQVTRQSAMARNGLITVLNTIQGNDLGGDGTVPRPAAVPLGCTPAEDTAFEETALFVSGTHGELQNLPEVADQVSYVLSATDFKSYRMARKPSDVISLAVEDAYTTLEPIEISCRAGSRQPHAVLTIQDAATGERILTREVELNPDEWRSLHLEPLSRGAYRATLETDRGRITDVFLVAH